MVRITHQIRAGHFGPLLSSIRVPQNAAGRRVALLSTQRDSPTLNDTTHRVYLSDISFYSVHTCKEKDNQISIIDGP